VCRHFVPRRNFDKMSKAPTGSRGAGFGLDAELARKQAEKYDVREEQMARNWIEKVTNERVEGDFGPALKNGRLLCNLMNTIKPGSIRKVETSNMPFKQMENISNFLKAARTVGIAEYELFETVDLYEEKVLYLFLSFPLQPDPNTPQLRQDLGVVVRCLHSLSRAVQRNVPTFTGPYLDPTFSAATAANNLSTPLAAVSLAAPAQPPPPPPRSLSPVPSSAAIASTLRSQPTPAPAVNRQGLNSTSAAIYKPNNPQPSAASPSPAATSAPPKPPKPTSTPAAPVATPAQMATGSRGAGFGLDAELAKKQVTFLLSLPPSSPSSPVLIG
jgi:hypothetical protein